MPAEGGSSARGMASPLACDIMRWGRRKGRGVVAGGPDGSGNGDAAVAKTGLTGSAWPDTENCWGSGLRRSSAASCSKRRRGGLIE